MDTSQGRPAAGCRRLEPCADACTRQRSSLRVHLDPEIRMPCRRGTFGVGAVGKSRGDGGRIDF
eukprot:3047973-Prymnesium_polylepis.1